MLQLRPPVLVVKSDVPKCAIDLLETKCDVIQCTSYDFNEEEILEKVRGVHAILWTGRDNLTKKIIDKAGPDLRIVSISATGVEHIDVDYLKARKIKIGVTPGIHADSVADHAIGLMIHACRRFHEFNLLIEEDKMVRQIFKTVGKIYGTDIGGKTVGFVGFGAIGQAIAKRLIGFEIAKIIYYSPTKKSLPMLNFQLVHVNFFELLTQSDIIFIVCPLNWQTENLFNEDAFNNMKRKAVLINVSNGRVVDENALVKALESNQIFAAGLDVFANEPLERNHPLLKLRNAILTPNLGTATLRTQIDVALVAVHNILRALHNEPLYAEY